MTRGLVHFTSWLAAGAAAGAAAVLWLSAGASQEASLEALMLEPIDSVEPAAAATSPLSAAPVQGDSIDVALAQLASIDEPAAALRFALEALDAVGYEIAAIDRVAAAQPEIVGRALRAAALERKARLDPDGAVRAALALEEPLRAMALRRVTAVWAAIEPSAAVSAVELVPAELRSQFLREVFTAWARSAPRELIEHLETTATTPAVVDNTLALRDFLVADPEQARAIAARLPPIYTRALYRMP